MKNWTVMVLRVAPLPRKPAPPFRSEFHAEPGFGGQAPPQTALAGPRRGAAGVRIDGSRSIGVMGEAVAAATFAGRLLSGIQDAAAEYGTTIMLANTSSDEELADWDIRALAERQVDGIIYASEHPRNLSPPAALAEIPHVVINSVGTTAGSRSVTSDQRGGARGAVEELRRIGHRKIGYLSAAVDDLSARERLLGFRSSLERKGLLDSALIVTDEPTADGGHRAAMKLFTDADPPTALVCFNDRMAAGAYRAAHEHKIVIPEELSIIAFEDIELLAEDLRPPLTTVHLPFYDMGRWAVYTLMDLTGESPTHEPAHIVLVCELIHRRSVAPPPP